MQLPSYVQEIVNVLNQAGHEAFVVGGAVRDYLLGEIPHDYDIATSATPKEVIALFPRTTSYGMKFGSVTVLAKRPVEVTTFRREGRYMDARRPLDVSFSKKIDDDLLRRDFTINAIAYSPKTGIYDPLCGIGDLELKIIRAVGDPVERFREDALRILRAVRFLAKLGPPWQIEEKTLEAMAASSHLVKKLSKERITDEIVRIASSRFASYGLEALEKISETAFGHPLQPLDLDALPLCEDLRLAGLTKANPWLFSWLVLSKKTQKYLEKVHLNRPIPESLPELRHLCAQVGRDHLDHWLILRGEPPRLHEIADDPIGIQDLAVGGKDLQKLFGEGPQVGEVLERLAYLVREDPSLNTREKLLQLASDQKEPGK